MSRPDPRSFDENMSTFAMQRVLTHMRDHKIARLHVTDRGFAQRDYTKLLKGKYGPHEGTEWLRDFGRLVQFVDGVGTMPPFPSKVRRADPIDWKAFFAGWKGFPEPPETFRPRLTGADPVGVAGAAGAAGDWRAVVPFEQELRLQYARDERLGDRSKLRHSIEKLAGLYEWTGEWHKAIPWLVSLKQVNTEINDVTFMADCFMRIGVANYRTRRWPEAAAMLREGLHLIASEAVLRNTKTELRIRSYAALTKLRMNDAAHALADMDTEIRRITDLHRSPYITSTWHHRRAIILTSLHRHTEAHLDFGRALTLRLSCTAHFEAARTLYHVGILSAEEGHWAPAAVIWDLCVARHLRFEDWLGLARANLRLGHAYRRLSAIKEDEAKLDLFEGNFSPQEVSAIEQIARDEGRALSLQHPTARLRDLAVGSFAAAAHWAAKAGDIEILKEAKALAQEGQGPPQREIQDLGHQA